MTEGYRCRRCGEYHEGLPTAYGADAPALWYYLTDEERESRAVLDEEFCTIDGRDGARHFFVKGNIEHPIVGGDGEVFRWTVWASLSEPNFRRTTDLWETPGREADAPYFGWLSTELPGYPQTLHLKTLVHTRPVGERPYIELEPTDHPLAVEQREGITRVRIQEIAEAVLHGE